MSISGGRPAAEGAERPDEPAQGPTLVPRESPLLYSICAIEAERTLVIRMWRANALLQRVDNHRGEFTINDFEGPYPWPPQLVSKDTRFDLFWHDRFVRNSLPDIDPGRGPNRPTLADREPTLAYRIVLVEAEEKVLIEARHADSTLQGDGDLIGTGTLDCFDDPIPPLQCLTSKDTDRIDALHDEVRDVVLQMDDWSRARLRSTGREHGSHRPSLAHREPTLIYRIAPVEEIGRVLISVLPENTTSKDLIPVGSVFLGRIRPYPRFQLLTSKDTSQIRALPDEVQGALLEMDAAVRERLKATTRQNAMRRLGRHAGPAAQKRPHNSPDDLMVVSTRIC